MKKGIPHIRRHRSGSNIPRIEPLEHRDYFDLVPSIGGPIPTEIVATVKNNSSVTVELTNSAGSIAKGSYTLTLFVSTSPILGAATDTQIGSVSKSIALPAGKATSVKFKLSDFPDVANGDYFLLGEVTGSLAGSDDNFAASTAAIAVSDPFVDLSDSVTIKSPANNQVLPGKPVGLAIEVFNNGNVPASGSLLTDLGLAASGLMAFDTTIHSDLVATVVTIATVSSHIHIAPGGNQIIHVSEKIPPGVTPGTYDVEAAIDPNNTFNESDSTNNTALSSSLTVLDPYPNLLGSYIGPDKIKHGPSKGATVTIDLDFTSESETTGALVASGTLFDSKGTSKFNLTGTISTKGVFVGMGSSSSSVFTATYRGKLTKNTLSGSVVNTDGNSGTFALKLTV